MTSTRASNNDSSAFKIIATLGSLKNKLNLVFTEAQFAYKYNSGRRRGWGHNGKSKCMLTDKKTGHTHLRNYVN